MFRSLPILAALAALLIYQYEADASTSRMQSKPSETYAATEAAGSTPDSGDTESSDSEAQAAAAVVAAPAPPPPAVAPAEAPAPAIAAPPAIQERADKRLEERDTARRVARAEQAPGKVAETAPLPVQVTAPAPIQAAAPAAVPAQAPTVIASGHDGFDPVPSSQRGAIAKRLKLVERLILEHGRAYDYRLLTNAELETILRTLEKSESSKAAPATTPQAAAQPANEIPAEAPPVDGT